MGKYISKIFSNPREKNTRVKKICVIAGGIKLLIEMVPQGNLIETKAREDCRRDHSVKDYIDHVRGTNFAARNL